MKWILSLFFLIFYGCSNLPSNISMESPTYQTDNVKFYYDLTHKRGDTIYTEHRIFNQMEKMIENAEEFIVMDVFLFNNLYNANEFNFPKVSLEIKEALIKKRKMNKDVKIYFITDEINTFYGVYNISELEELEKNGITVILTDLTKTNGANRIYSTFWKTFFSWFGTGENGWLTNPFSPKAPKVTIRSYLKLMNLKGNHRKLLVTEKEAFITSANPHSASGYHSNIGFKFDGNIINSVVESEKAVGELSKIEMKLPTVKFLDKGKYKVQLLTEGKIGKALDSDIDNSQNGDEIYIGMFYLGDTVIVKKLIDAAKRGVKIRIILDENNEAFGMKKTGIPNKVTGKKLIDNSNDKIEVKWYRSSGEQYHTKLVVIKTSDEIIVNGGSANLTKRNIRDYTLDTNIRIVAPKSSKLSTDIEQYFNMLWDDDEDIYTMEKQELEKGYISKKILYNIQNASGFSTY